MIIKADANKQISFEISFQRQINDPDIFITMDPAETRDWIDIIISSEYIQNMQQSTLLMKFMQMQKLEKHQEA